MVIQIAILDALQPVLTDVTAPVCGGVCPEAAANLVAVALNLTAGHGSCGAGGQGHRRAERDGTGGDEGHKMRTLHGAISLGSAAHPGGVMIHLSLCTDEANSA
jgi:hypothetical protein